jgi:hypothetical protein
MRTARAVIRPCELTAQQLVALFPDFTAVREFIAEHAEHVVLRCYRPRHAPAARFAYWRARLRKVGA